MMSVHLENSTETTHMGLGQCFTVATLVRRAMVLGSMVGAMVKGGARCGASLWTRPYTVIIV